jgi:uncharacterized protein (DUF2384 family)
MRTSSNSSLKNISTRIEHSEIPEMVIQLGKNSKKLFVEIKNITNEDDKEISNWLNINERTFRTQKATTTTLKPILAEQVIMLISLFKHGIEIFGNSENFKTWLEKENFHFDKKSPLHFIDTISGIRFIDDRLTGMEYGDNA